MAFDVSGLAAYGKEDGLPLLTKAVTTTPTSELLQGAGQIIPGIKSTYELNILASDAVFQDGAGCDISPSGTTTFTNRTLTVGQVAIREKLCPKTLNQKWIQTQMRAGSAGDNEVPFAEVIAEEKIKALQNTLETSIWQGTVSANRFNGFNTILTALGFGGAGDPIEGNPSTGGGWTKLTSLTSSNIDDAIAKMVDQAMASTDGKAILDRSDRFIAMGRDTFLLYRRYLIAANLYHFNPGDGNEYQIADPETGTMIYGLPGLTGTNKIHLSYWANYFMGTDLLNEEEQFEFVFDPLTDNTVYKANFKAGVQIAFPTQVVYFSL